MLIDALLILLMYSNEVTLVKLASSVALPGEMPCAVLLWEPELPDVLQPRC